MQSSQIAAGIKLADMALRVQYKALTFGWYI